MRAITLTLFFALHIVASIGSDCKWDKDEDYPTPYPPVVMDPDQWKTVLPVLEGDSRIVTVKEGRQVVIACPGSEIEQLKQEVVNGTCVGGLLLRIGDQDLPMSSLGCSQRPKESIRQNVMPCGEGGMEQIIGFNISGYQFYNMIWVCFNPALETTLYSKNVIRGNYITAKDVNPDRPSFKSDSGYFTVSPNTCYQQDSQKELMATLLGNASVIDPSQSLYFARGHMAPDADFVTEQEQDSTYHYINAVPQWQAFNNGNWKKLEACGRELAGERSVDIETWSGGWQVLQLADTNNNLVDIFLGLTQDQSVIPAPDVTWKVVYDPMQNEAAAVVGVNNPYLTEFPEPICGSPDTCEQLKWLDLDTADLVHGATYCCTAQDLHKVVPNAPDLGDATLLTG